MAALGSAGSGKTTLLLALLGEVPCVSGRCAAPSFLAKAAGKVAYCGLQPQLIRGSVCENVLFGRPYDHDRYLDTMAACGLADLAKETGHWPGHLKEEATANAYASVLCTGITCVRVMLRCATEAVSTRAPQVPQISGASYCIDERNRPVSLDSSSTVSNLSAEADTLYVHVNTYKKYHATPGTHAHTHLHMPDTSKYSDIYLHLLTEPST
ncbi:ABCC13 [Symbiodinium sp. CCMP2592]|nr:ABCC13 [Symbiodinium sp. CCMP2592]